MTGHEFHRTHVTSVDDESSWSPAWIVDGEPIGFAGPTLHASYLHTHWAGHPQLAQRFADAVHDAAPHRPAASPAPVATAETQPIADPLRHHGDVEATQGLLDLAVNVFPGPWPSWLDQAMRAGLEASGTYPSAADAEAGLARHHGVDPDRVLATAGSAEAFTLVAGLRAWRRPVVVHPQFTEPHAALVRAGHQVHEVHCRAPEFRLDPAEVPEDADLVVVGNPTNPTGVLHPADQLRRLLRPGRLVVVDEAFMDVVPGEAESVAGEPGLLVLRSLTKHWGIPGVRAGYLLGDEVVVQQLREVQVPWSVSSTAAAALEACASPVAAADRLRRAETVGEWRRHLEKRLAEVEVPFVAVRSVLRARPSGCRCACGTASRGRGGAQVRHLPGSRRELGADRRTRSRAERHARGAAGRAPGPELSRC